MYRRPTGRSARLRRLTTLAVGVTAAVTLTACGGGSDEDAKDTDDAPARSEEAARQGLVTEQAAEKVVDTYEQVNNRANAKRDEKLLGTVEAGQLHEQSKADYTQWKTWSKKDQKEYASSFHYTKREYLIPAADSGVTWFAVKTRASADPDGEGALLVFDKEGGDTYRMTMAVYADEGPIPEVAVDEQGFVTPADPSKKVGALAPDRLGEAYEDFFETGGKEKAARTFASTDTSRTSVKISKEGPDDDVKAYATKKFFAAQPAHPKVYALRLADGKTLTVFPTAHTNELMLKPRYMSGFDITPTEEESLYDGTKRDVVTDEFQGQGLAVLDPAGKPRVTALEYRMVDSR
ncbi:hypothetical protein ACGH52_15265 [Streptomyces sp. BBFR25]|uniref:hypothetical protein n=1 Tax=Streptomyces sp. BBFR25 TaxID=3372855 RepID=UPI0037DC0BFB